MKVCSTGHPCCPLAFPLPARAWCPTVYVPPCVIGMPCGVCEPLPTRPVCTLTCHHNELHTTVHSYSCAFALDTTWHIETVCNYPLQYNFLEMCHVCTNLIEHVCMFECCSRIESAYTWRLLFIGAPGVNTCVYVDMYVGR